jgi:HemY protein
MWFLKFFWSIIQVVFLFAVMAWLYFTFGGDVTLTWNDYKISTNAGVASAFLFACLIVIVFFAHVIGDLVRLPSDLARKHREKKRAKGQQALLRALSSASAGDYKNAYYLAHRAQKYLPESEQGMSLLLQAHAAKSQGKDANAAEAFEALVKHPDTSVLGVQGLLQKRVLDGDVRGALELARAQYRAHPKNIHLLRPVYDLERRNGLWNDALVTLDKLQSSHVIQKSEAQTDRAVLWIILGDMAKTSGTSQDALRAYQRAHSADKSFAPAISRLARAHAEKGQRLRAVSIAKAGIEKHFHPSFVRLWDDLKPKDHDARWFTWLIERVPASAESYCLLARYYMAVNLWGEARTALAKHPLVRVAG